MSEFFNINSGLPIHQIKTNSNNSVPNNQARSHDDDKNYPAKSNQNNHNDVIFTTLANTKFKGVITYLAIYSGSKDAKVVELVSNLHEGDIITFQIGIGGAEQNNDFVCVKAKVISSSETESNLRAQFGLIRTKIPQLPVGTDVEMWITANEKSLSTNTKQLIASSDSNIASIKDLVESLERNSRYFNLVTDLLKPQKDPIKYREFVKLLGATTNPELARKLIRGTRNVSYNEVDRWIDEELFEPIISAKDDHAVKKIAQKFKELKEHTRTETSDWTEITFPIYIGENIQSVHLYAQKTKLTTNYMSRFILDTSLQDNQIQLEGLIELNELNRINKFNLNIRSIEVLSENLQRRLRQVFSTHAGLNNINGDIIFQQVPAISKLFIEDFSHEHDIDSVVISST